MNKEFDSANPRVFTVYFLVLLCAGITLGVALVTVCTMLASNQPAVEYSR
jgi:SNF family Na+-dependent transporter